MENHPNEPEVTRKPAHSERRKSMKSKVIIALVVLVLAGVLVTTFIGNFFVVIPEGHVGVAIRLGEAQKEVLGPGFHWKSPVVHIVLMDTRWQKYTANTSAFSRDIQQVDVIVSMSYQLIGASAQRMYASVGTDYQEKIMNPRLLDALKSTFAKYSAEELISNRERISYEVLDLLTDQLSFYDLTVREIAIEDIDFTDAFTDAIEAKQVATQKKLQTETEQEQQTIIAEGEAARAKIAAQAAAEKMQIEAEAKANAVKIAADAEAYRLEMVNKNITENVIRKEAVERWNGELPAIMGSDMTSVLNVTDLVK